MKCSALGSFQKGSSKTRLVVVVVAAAAAAVVVVFEILAETRCAIQIHSTSFFSSSNHRVEKEERCLNTKLKSWIMLAANKRSQPKDSGRIRTGAPLSTAWDSAGYELCLPGSFNFIFCHCSRVFSILFKPELLCGHNQWIRLWTSRTAQWVLTITRTSRLERIGGRACTRPPETEPEGINRDLLLLRVSSCANSSISCLFSSARRITTR